MLRRAPWLALIVVGQLGLLWLFLERSQVRTGQVSSTTALGSKGGDDPNIHGDYYTLGDPVWWAGYTHYYRRSKFWEKFDYWILDGWNPLVPLAAAVLVLVPPVVVIELLWRAMRWPAVLPTRLVRCLGVMGVAAFVGLYVSRWGAPTWRDMTPVKRGQVQRNEPNKWAVAEVARDREAWDLPPAWIRYTAVTAVGLGVGSFLGCLIFRPWRRAGGPSASHGVAATTPPPA